MKVKKIQFWVTLILVFLYSTETAGKSFKIESDTNKIKFQEYLDKMEALRQTLDSDRIEKREEWLRDIKNTKTYELLVINKIVEAKYLPLLNAVSYGVASFHPEGFSFSQDAFEQLELVEEITSGSKDFAIKTTLLAVPSNGGLTKDLIEVFKRYEKAFGVYGREGSVMNKSTSKNEKVYFDYDLSSTLIMVEPKDINYLNKFYVARLEEVSSWDADTIEFLYPYIALKKEYMRHLKEVYPESKFLVEVDLELSSDSLISSFYHNKILTDMNYSGKRILVKGKIWATYYRGDKVFVQLGNSEFDQKIEFSFNKKQSDLFVEGKIIMIVGKYSGQANDNVIKFSDSEIWLAH